MLIFCKLDLRQIYIIYSCLALVHEKYRSAIGVRTINELYSSLNEAEDRVNP
jgi:hypothetical protein